jgi:hypothetical protein
VWGVFVCVICVLCVCGGSVVWYVCCVCLSVVCVVFMLFCVVFAFLCVFSAFRILCCMCVSLCKRVVCVICMSHVFVLWRGMLCGVYGVLLYCGVLCL